jgi:hypothetical protein
LIGVGELAADLSRLVLKKASLAAWTNLGFRWSLDEFRVI